MSKFEKQINKVGWELLHRNRDEAEKLFKELWPHKEEMSDVEQDVLYAHRESLYGRPFSGGFSERSYYWEGRILERQESDWD